MAKILKTWEGLKKGQKFVVISNSNGHNYPIGKTLIMKKPGVVSTQMTDIAEGISGNTIEVRDVRLTAESLSDLHEHIVEVQEELDKTMSKIKLCNDLGLTEYDDNVIKVHKALAIIKSKKSDIEQSQAIANLIAEITE